jgi:hypothetical protein
MTTQVTPATELTYVVMTPWALASFPKVLAIANPKYKLVAPLLHITPRLFDYLSFGGKSDTLIELFVDSEKAGLVEVRDIEPKDKWWSNVYIELARSLFEEGKRAIIVGTESENYELLRKLDLLSITNSLEVISVRELRELLNTSESSLNSQLLELANRFKKESGYNSLKYGSLLWFFFAIVQLFAFFKLPVILSFLNEINVWVAIPFVVVFAVFLFWYRAKHRLAYGVLETTFGVLIASKVIYSNLDLTKLSTSDYVQLASGIYVIVRGLDNVEKGLVYIDSEAIKDIWNRMFGPPRPRI